MAEGGTGGKSGPDLWLLAGRGVTLAIILLAIGLMAYQTLRHVVTIAPITSTNATASLGLTPEVAAQHLHDALTAIAAGADGVRRPNLSLESQKPDVTLPEVGVSIEAVARYIRGILHIDGVRNVSGDFTEADGRIWLRLRVDDRLVYQSPPAGVPAQAAQQELDNGARMVAREITPYLYAAYLHHIRDPQEIATLRWIVTAPTADPVDVADAQKLWGQIMAEQQDPVAALDHYREALRLYTAADLPEKSSELQNYIGQAYLQAGDYDKARDAYREALRSPSSWQSKATAWLNLGDVLRDHDRDLPAALAAYQNALSVDPRMRYAHDAEGRVLEAMGRYSEAASNYLASINDYPGDAQSYVHLAQLVVDQPDAFSDVPGMLHRVTIMASATEVTCPGPP